MANIDEAAVIDATRRWISSLVIGLNLCPFAGRVFETDKIRYVVSDAADEETLRKHLAAELRAFVSVPIAQVETTLLIHPHVLGNFLDYNDFLDVAERLIGSLGLAGIVPEIASFHPDYRFGDADPEAVENYTNRSPYPMLHLLREESISAAAGDPEALLGHPRRNVETLRALGREKILEQLRAIQDDPKRGTITET